MRIFHFYTIANRAEEYAAMRASFLAGGFDEKNSEFTAFDNTKGNESEPYGILQSLVQSTSEPYIIFCHQDVRLNPEHNAERLAAVLEQLDRVDPDWMVAGNAGFDFGGDPVLHLDDPGGKGRDSRLPRKVLSLDENFLILKSGTKLKASSDLEGFHLYGTDLCLNAYLLGGAAYVIDFLVVHLSPGNPTSQQYLDALEAFKRKWRKHFVFCLIRTTCSQILLSRDALVEMLLPRYGTIAEFLWKLEEPLIATPRFLPFISTRVLAATVIVGSGCWYFFRRPWKGRTEKPVPIASVEGPPEQRPKSRTEGDSLSPILPPFNTQGKAEE